MQNFDTHLPAAPTPQPQAVLTHAVLAPHLRPPPVPHAQAVAPHLRHLTPEQRQHFAARALARETQATTAPAQQPGRGTAPPPPLPTHLALQFTYIRQFHHIELEDHICPYIAPNLVCPCQLSGHQCKGQPRVKKTYDGRSWMCGLEEVCTKQACTSAPPDQRCPVKYHARPTCGSIKGTMRCPGDAGKRCAFGHDDEGEDWRRVLHEYESTVHHPR